MSEQKQARARATVDFLRTSLRSLAASTPGRNRRDSLAAAEVEQDLHCLLEGYALGNIPEPRSFLSDPSIPENPADTVAIR